MKYLGIEFKNYEEIKDWNRDGHISEYKQLAELFANRPTIELSSMMSDRAIVLHDRFDMSWEEIEALEIA